MQNHRAASGLTNTFGSALGAKKEARVVRRSDLEYYSSLQTTASAMKFAQSEDQMSTNKTAEKLRQDRLDDKVNM